MTGEGSFHIQPMEPATQRKRRAVTVRARSAQPTAAPRKRRRRLPVHVKRSRWDQLLSAAAPGRDRALIAVMLFAGLRVSEACALQARDVQFHDARIHVRHGKGDKEAYVPLGGRLRGILQAHIPRGAAPTDPVFRGRGGRAIGRVQAWRIVQAAGDRAGLGRLWPHALRHSCGTALLEAGQDLMEVRDYLRHSSISTTQIYLHVATDRLQAAADSLG